MKLILTHKKIGIAFALDIEWVESGVWLGAEAHACANCAQLNFDFLLFSVKFTLMKKMPGFDEALVAQIKGEPMPEPESIEMPLTLPPIDFREFTSLAISGLNKKDGRRVGKALDVAILFGVMEYVGGNESLKDMKELHEVASRKMEELRRLS